MITHEIYEIRDVQDYENMLSFVDFKCFGEDLILLDYRDMRFYFIEGYEIFLDGETLVSNKKKMTLDEVPQFMNDVVVSFLNNINRMLISGQGIKVKIYKNSLKESCDVAKRD